MSYVELICDIQITAKFDFSSKITKINNRFIDLLKTQCFMNFTTV
jgi:hypothetical protein